MPTATSVLTAFAGIVAAISIAIYFFGIPPELKRKMEKQALKTMGENKASYLVKDQISKMPASDQKDIKDFKKGLGNVIGGGLNNPIGEKTGDIGDDLTKDFTGR
jgi:fumarylacetoacetate (FAA) hydrolase family protein